LKNVLISRIRRYIFTEDQLRAYWGHKGKGVSFDSLTNDQLMDLAQQMLNNASHHDLEHHLLDAGWHTERELEGETVAERDTEDFRHIEVIDTSKPGKRAQLIIDRVFTMACKSCRFSFYVDVRGETDGLKCPNCGGEVEIKSKKTVVGREKR